MPSSRANAARYSGSVNYGGPSIMQILAAAKGYNETEGGPQLRTMPDGTEQWVFTPATAKKGFLSRWGTGRAQANALNAQIGGEAYLQQEKGKQSKEEIKLQGTQNKEIEMLRSKLADEIGEKTANRAITLMIKTAEENRRTNREQQHNEVLGKAGVVNRGNEDVETYGRALNDPMIRNSLARTRLGTDIATSPEALAGGRAAAVAPVFENFAKGSFNTPDGTITTIPSRDWRELGNLSLSPQVIGSGRESVISQGPPRETVFGGKVFTEPGEQRATTKTTPGYNRIPVNPDLIRQAGTIPPPPANTFNPNDRLQGLNPATLDPQMLKTLIDLYMQQQQQRN